MRGMEITPEKAAQVKAENENRPRSEVLYQKAGRHLEAGNLPSAAMAGLEGGLRDVFGFFGDPNRSVEEKAEGTFRTVGEFSGVNPMIRAIDARSGNQLADRGLDRLGLDPSQYTPGQDETVAALGAMFSGGRGQIGSAKFAGRAPGLPVTPIKDAALDAVSNLTGGASDLAIMAGKPIVEAAAKGTGALRNALRTSAAPITSVPPTRPAQPRPPPPTLNATPVVKKSTVPKSTDTVLRQLLKSASVPRDSIDALQAALVDGYKTFQRARPEGSERFSFARWIDKNLPEAASKAGIQIPDVTVRDVQQALRGRGRTAHGDAGPGDQSRAIMSQTIGDLRTTQKDYAKGRIGAEFGVADLAARKKAVQKSADEIGRDYYGPALDFAKKVWTGAEKAQPGEKEALTKLKDYLLRKPYLQNVPDYVKLRLAVDEVPLETRIAEDPAGVAQMIQSKLGQAASEANDPAMRGALGEARERLLKELETAIPGYRQARLDMGDEYRTLRSADFGRTFFADTRRPVDLADLADDFKKMTTSQKTMAKNSVRDEIYSVFDMGPEDAAIRLEVLTRESTLKGLEEVFGTPGQNVADVLRELREESLWLRGDGQRTLQGVDSLSGSNTVPNSVSRVNDAKAVRSGFQTLVTNFTDKGKVLTAALLDAAAMLGTGGMYHYPVLTGAAVAGKAARGLGNPSKRVLAESTEGLFALPPKQAPVAAPPKPKTTRGPRAPRGPISGDMRQLLEAFRTAPNKTARKAIQKQIRALYNQEQQAALPAPSSGPPSRKGPAVKNGFGGGSLPPEIVGAGLGAAGGYANAPEGQEAQFALLGALGGGALGHGFKRAVGGGSGKLPKSPPWKQTGTLTSDGKFEIVQHWDPETKSTRNYLVPVPEEHWPKNPPTQNGFTPSKPPLDMGEASRMERAREQGFDVDTPLYRGRKDNGREVDSFRASENPENNYGRGVYLTNDPGFADEFAGVMNPGGAPSVGGSILPVYARGKIANLLEMPEVNKAFDDAWRAGDFQGIQKVQDELRARGFDGLRIYDEVVIFDPKNIRGKFAQFDPSQSQSSKILAGFPEGSADLAVVGAGGAYGTFGPLEDLDKDGDKDVDDRRLMLVKYGGGAAFTPIAARMALATGKQILRPKSALRNSLKSPPKPPTRNVDQMTFGPGKGGEPPKEPPSNKLVPARPPKKPTPPKSKAEQEIDSAIRAENTKFAATRRKLGRFPDQRDPAYQVHIDALADLEARRAKIRANDARGRSLKARAGQLGFALKDPVKAAGTGLALGALGSGALLLNNALNPKKYDPTINPNSPEYFWESFKKSETNVRGMQHALDAWGLWPKDTTPNGNPGPTTRDGLRAWRSRKGLNPDAPMTKQDMLRLFAGPNGYIDKDGKTWRYWDGRPVTLSEPPELKGQRSLRNHLEPAEAAR